MIWSLNEGVAVKDALDAVADTTAQDVNEGSRSASAGQRKDSAEIGDGRRTGLDRWQRAREEGH